MDTSLDSGWRQTPLGRIFHLAQLYLIPYVGSTLGELHNTGIEGLKILGVSNQDINDIEDACQIKAKHTLPESCADELRQELRKRAMSPLRPQPKTSLAQQPKPVSDAAQKNPRVRKPRSAVRPQPLVLKTAEKRPTPDDGSDTLAAPTNRRITALRLNAILTGTIERSGFEMIDDITHCTKANFQQRTGLDDNELDLVGEGLIKLGLFFKVEFKPHKASP